MENNTNIPQLRFPEFKQEWEKKRLRNIATFSKGKNISKSDIIDSGKTECIRYGELYTHYSETIQEIKSKTNIAETDLIFSKENDILIPSSGETQIDIATASCILKSGVALGGDLNIIRTSENGVFLSYYLNNERKKDIAKLAQGISVVHLYSSQLGMLTLNLPSLPEQQKIATFLTKVDNRINQLKKKKDLLTEYKKGMMQKIFSQEIKFHDDNGKDFPKWEEKRLGEVGTTYNGLNGKSKEDFGKGEFYIQYLQVFGESKINISKFGKVNIAPQEKQNIIRYGDVFFTTSSETPNEIGTSSVLLDKCENVYLNSFCFGFRPNSLEELVPNFSQFLFRSIYFRKKIIKLAQGSTRFNMSKVELLKLRVNLPSLPEQTKIANFLSVIDNTINHCQQQIEQNQKWKKGLLQKMFV